MTSISQVFSVFLVLGAMILSLALAKGIDGIKLETVKDGPLKSGMNIHSTLQGLIIKVVFREKYMKKKGIELITAELEEEMTESEETFDYSNMNIRDGGESVWILCNQAEERAKIREFLAAKEVTLVIESDGKRYFGRYASKAEKDKYREANKDGGGLFGSAKKAAAEGIKHTEGEGKVNKDEEKPKKKGKKQEAEEDKAMKDKINEMILDGVPMKTVKPLPDEL